MKKVTLILFAVTLGLFTACNQGQKKSDKSTDTEAKAVEQVAKETSQKLSGDYICTAHWNDDLVGKAKMTFDNDSVSLAGIAKTTYRIKGDSLFVDMHQYEMGFVIDGKTLTTTGPAGKVSYTKQ